MTSIPVLITGRMKIANHEKAILWTDKQTLILLLLRATKMNSTGNKKILPVQTNGRMQHTAQMIYYNKIFQGEFL